MSRWKLPIIVFVSFMCGLSVSALSNEGDGPNIKPIRFEPLKTPYSEMSTDFPPWPQESIISGESIHRYKILYSGDITVEVFEAKPLKLRLDDYSIDEFITVVSGKLILTADGEEPQHFEVGDSVLLPKGFNGIWEMQGNFREIVAYKSEQL